MACEQVFLPMNVLVGTCSGRAEGKRARAIASRELEQEDEFWWIFGTLEGHLSTRRAEFIAGAARRW